MTLHNDRQLANSKRKLAELELLIRTAQSQPGPGRDTELKSLTRLANQLREEVAEYEAADATRT